MYTIKREERENHKGRMKACLYCNGNKIAVMKEGRLRLKTSQKIPQKWLDDLSAEDANIRNEEAAAGLV